MEAGISQRLYGVEYGKGLRAVSAAVGVEAQDKACLAVKYKPKVVLFAMNFDYSFISVPLVRVEIQCRNEL